LGAGPGSLGPARKTPGPVIDPSRRQTPGARPRDLGGRERRRAKQTYPLVRKSEGGARPGTIGCLGRRADCAGGPDKPWPGWPGFPRTCGLDKKKTTFMGATRGGDKPWEGPGDHPPAKGAPRGRIQQKRWHVPSLLPGPGKFRRCLRAGLRPRKAAGAPVRDGRWDGDQERARTFGPRATIGAISRVSGHPAPGARPMGGRPRNPNPLGQRRGVG